MTKVMSEPRQWKLTKSDIFSWDIFKSEVIFFIEKKKDLVAFKIKILSVLY